MIPDSVLCTCKIEVPEEPKILEEGEGTDSLVPQVEEERIPHLNVLATSVLLGTTQKHGVTTQNDSLPKRIKERAINIYKPQAYKDEHKCEAVSVNYNSSDDALEIKVVSETYTDWQGMKYQDSCIKTPKLERQTLKIQGLEGKTTARHALIYAPPGCGKTTLQRKLHAKAVAIVDTDDVPFCDKQDVEDMLRWTSVLTNRLDLVTTDYPCVMFSPSTVEAMGRSLKGQVDESDVRYWYEEHQKKRDRARVVILYHKTYLSSWLTCEKAGSTPWCEESESRIRREFENSTGSLDKT